MRYFLVTISLIMTIVRLLKIYLNKIHREKGITNDLLCYYSESQYSKWMRYETKRDKYIVIKVLVTFCLNCLFYLTSFYSVIHNLFVKDIIINSLCMMFVVY